MKPTQQQIDNLLNQCLDNEDNGLSAYPGMRYEQGIIAAVAFMQGEGPQPIENQEADNG